MIDTKVARQRRDEYRQALTRKGAAELFNAFLAADERWRALQAEADALRARTRFTGKPTAEQLTELTELKAELQTVESRLKHEEKERQQALDRVPNPPAGAAPDGFTDDDAVEIRRGGVRPQFVFEPLDHLDLGRLHGWIDTEQAATVAGSRFVYRLGDLVRLELAAYQLALSRLAEKGFVPVLPPVLVKEAAMYGTGFLPTDEANIYGTERDDLYLTGTSEVALAALHLDQTLDADSLPLRYAGYSTCFRREAGAAGKDTRGMFRVHQFDKVEMFAFVMPEDSRDEHEYLLSIEEELVNELGIPYRVVNIAAGDLGASAARKYDIEAWFPGQGRYREITSTSNTTDYQARRLRVRYRGTRGSSFVHTLNGTAMTARAVLAVLENFQNEDGSVTVPQALVDFGAPPVAGATPVKAGSIGPPARRTG